MLTNDFISLCENFANSRNDVLDEMLLEHKKTCNYLIELNSCALEFRYIKKAFGYFKPSSLYCVIHLKKRSVVHYHLPDIIPFLEHKTFDPCYFWNIENTERLDSCFSSLVKTLENVLSQLTPFILDDSVLLKSLFENYKNIYNLKDTSIDFTKIEDQNDYAQNYFLNLQNMRDGFVFSRFCNFKPFELLVENKTEKALEKYEEINQKGKLFEYEKCLIDHIKSINFEFSVFDSSCDTSLADKVHSPLNILKAFLIIFTISSILFCGVFVIYNLIISANTLVVLSAPWYTSFCCAALCSIFGTIALISHIPISNKHITKKEAKEFLKTLVPTGTKKFSLITFILSIIASIFFAVMILVSNVRFYDNKITFDSKTRSYENINSVYYISARYNDFGDRIERDSYVILFNDKTALDLDGYTSVEFTKKEVLPLLKDKGFDVKFADSEKDLPWYIQN